MKGIIIKNQNGYFSVLDGERILPFCRTRGKLKRQSDILVGDRVEYTLVSNKEGLIESIYPRHTLLYRPPIANIDRIALVMSIQTPDLDTLLLDKMISLSENAEIEPLILISKSDLAPEEANTIVARYRNIGYCCLATSSYKITFLPKLRSALEGHIVAFSGPSGAGKSTLLNAILGRNQFLCQEVSRQTGRGKTTTRHAELVSLDSTTLLMDTPGYTLLDINSIDEENLAYTFKEFRAYLGQCQFNDCNHLREPNCAIIQAVEDGNISHLRYASYKQFHEDKKVGKRRN